VRGPILEHLARVAADWQVVGIWWHAAAAALLVSLFGLRRGGVVTATAALSMMVLSVAVAAFWMGNAFNAAVFLSLAMALLAIVLTLSRAPIRSGEPWEIGAGVAMCVFGWVYPHFVAGPWWRALYASPLGLLPCPTLSMVIGVSLIAGGFQCRWWRVTISSAGLFYGLFGAIVLGVRIDWALAAGAACLAAGLLTSRAPGRRLAMADSRRIV
jgi:hypothetical protein